MAVLLARALEHHVGGPPGDPFGLPGGKTSSSAGVQHLDRPEVGGQLLAPLAGLHRGDRADPTGHQGGDGQRTDRSGPDDHHAVPGGDPRAGDPVQRHGQRFGQGRLARGQAGR